MERPASTIAGRGRYLRASKGRVKWETGDCWSREWPLAQCCRRTWAWAQFWWATDLAWRYLCFKCHTCNFAFGVVLCLRTNKIIAFINNEIKLIYNFNICQEFSTIASPALGVSSTIWAMDLWSAAQAGLSSTSLKVCLCCCLTAFITGFINAPKRQRIYSGLCHVRNRAPFLGGNFGLWGGLFSSTECLLISYR